MKKLIRGALLAAAAILASGAALADTMVIDNVTLIDGTGQPAQAGMSVAIDDDRFVAVTPTAVAGNVKGDGSTARVAG